MPNKPKPQPVKIKLDIDVREPLYIQVVEFRGEVRLDIRHHYSDSVSGEDLPSKKGISMPYEMGQELLQALVALYTE